MKACINNLNLEILELNPKIIFVLGKLTYNFISKYFQKNNLDISKLAYLEHPSYIYVYNAVQKVQKNPKFLQLSTKTFPFKNSLLRI